MPAPIQGSRPILPIETPEPVPTGRTAGAAGSTGAGVIGTAGGSAAPKGTGFEDVLGNALGEAGKAERVSNDAAERFAAGDPQMGIHEVMIAAEKANISVRYAVTLKNKLLEAYRELMNTPL